MPHHFVRNDKNTFAALNALLSFRFRKHHAALLTVDEDEFDDFTEQREAPALPRLSGTRNIRVMSGLKIYYVINRNILALLHFVQS